MAPTYRSHKYGQILQIGVGQIIYVSYSSMRERTVGVLGVHFRYGASVLVKDDGSLVLSATERNSVLGSGLAVNE